MEECGKIAVLETDRIQVEPMGSDIQDVVKKHVSCASSCAPVFCSPFVDTHLLFTYCHKICDESFHDTMILKALVVEEASATMIQIRLPYNQSEHISLRQLSRKLNMRGVCFAWTEREGDPMGFRIKYQRLAPIFYAFYSSSETGQTLDFTHSNPVHSSYVRERHFLVPHDGTQVTAIVCAPLDAYQNKASQLPYTFGLREKGTSWRYITQEIPFAPTLWVNLGELFNMTFKVSSIYSYWVRGPKGKGWLLTQTSHDFNLHHL